MGLYNFPFPAEGVLGLILVHTGISIKICKAIIQSILHIIGIHISQPEIEPLSESCGTRQPPSETFMEEFRKQVPAIRFGSVSNCNSFDQECLVCLTGFHRDSMINHLCCGHVFHKACLEKWLDYWKFTCPLCRTPLMSKEEADPPYPEASAIEFT